MRFIVFLVSVFLTVSSIAQVQYITRQPTRAELEAQRKKTQEEINETEQELEKVKNDKRATMGDLSALQNKLALRQRQIGNINDELGDIDNSIKKSSKEIVTMKQKLEQLKVRYSQSIRYAYETRSSYDMLAFLFSSRDFNDAMRRMKYLKKFREFRKAQVEQIRETQAQLQHKIGTLNTVKAQKDELLQEQVQQKQTLLKETEKKDQVIKELKGKEGELLKRIEKNRKVAQKINNYIKLQIEKEMEEAAKRAEEAEKKKAAELAKAAGGAAPGAKPGNAPAPANNNAPRPTAPKVEREAPSLLLTPTDVALASSFEGNKGKLYWPVEKGYITDHFGQHPHPLAPQVLVDNAGIDIQTVPNADVRAVYEGTVSNIFSTGGSSQIVMIEHGNYFTLYNGLATVTVKKGQHVSTREVIGQVANNDNDVPSVNFQIWKATGKKGSIKLNPEQWIGRAH
jgi:murein hydrolase activator